MKFSKYQFHNGKESSKQRKKKFVFEFFKFRTSGLLTPPPPMSEFVLIFQTPLPPGSDIFCEWPPSTFRLSPQVQQIKCCTHLVKCTATLQLFEHILLDDNILCTMHCMLAQAQKIYFSSWQQNPKIKISCFSQL